MYHSFVLATWFKRKLKDSIYKYYIDQNKIQGINLEDTKAKEKIFNLYVEAYRQGVYNYTKKYNDKLNRNYTSGGAQFYATQATYQVTKADLGVGELTNSFQASARANIILNQYQDLSQGSSPASFTDRLLGLGVAAAAIGIVVSSPEVADFLDKAFGIYPDPDMQFNPVSIPDIRTFAVKENGNIICGLLNGDIEEYDKDGALVNSFYDIHNATALTVTKDGHVVTYSATSGRMNRYNNLGELVESLPIGLGIVDFAVMDDGSIIGLIDGVSIAKYDQSGKQRWKVEIPKDDFESLKGIMYQDLFLTVNNDGSLSVVHKSGTVVQYALLEEGIMKVKNWKASPYGDSKATMMPQITSVASRDGSTIVFGYKNGHVAEYTIDGEGLIGELLGDGAIDALAANSGGDIVTSSRGSVKVYKVKEFLDYNLDRLRGANSPVTAELIYEVPVMSYDDVVAMVADSHGAIAIATAYGNVFKHHRWKRTAILSHNIYLGDEDLIAGLAIGSDGMIITATQQGYMYKHNQEGAQEFRRELAHFLNDRVVTITINSDNQIIVATEQGSLYVYDYDGQFLFSYKIDLLGNEEIVGLVMAGNGYPPVVGTNYGRIIKLRRDNSVVSSYQVSLGLTDALAALVVESNGAVMVVTRNGFLLQYDRKGKIVLSSTVDFLSGNDSITALYKNNDKGVIIATEYGKVYSVTNLHSSSSPVKSRGGVVLHGDNLKMDIVGQETFFSNITVDDLQEARNSTGYEYKILELSSNIEPNNFYKK